MARGLAILGVLLIHGTSRPVADLAPASTLYPLYLAINYGAQFAVPLFFLMSALVLIYRLGGRAGMDWGEFYRRRFGQVAVPYLAWTALYAAVRLAFVESGPVTPGRVLLWFVAGKGWFHLYFLAVLIQFYVVFPLLYRFRGVFRLGFGWALALILALQVAFYWLDKLYVRPHYPFSTVLNYAVPLGLGLWLGSNVSRWSDFWRLRRWLVVPGAVAAGALYVGWSVAGALAAARGLAGPAGVLPVSPFVLQLASYLYVGLAPVTFLFLARVVAGKGLARWLGRLGEASFGIYLVHPAVLAAWEHFWKPSTPALFHASVAAGLVLALTVSWAVTWLIGRTPFRRLLLGGR